MWDSAGRPRRMFRWRKCCASPVLRPWKAARRQSHASLAFLRLSWGSIPASGGDPALAARQPRLARSPSPSGPSTPAAGGAAGGGKTTGKAQARGRRVDTPQGLGLGHRRSVQRPDSVGAVGGARAAASPAQGWEVDRRRGAAGARRGARPPPPDLSQDLVPEGVGGRAAAAHLQRLAQLQVEGDHAHALQPGGEARPGRSRGPRRAARRRRRGRAQAAASPASSGARRRIHGGGSRCVAGGTGAAAAAARRRGAVERTPRGRAARHGRVRPLPPEGRRPRVPPSAPARGTARARVDFRSGGRGCVSARV